MRYFWLRDRKEQDHFLYLWDYGDQNDGDYFTKYHSTHYHKDIRSIFIKDVVSNIFHNVE